MADPFFLDAMSWSFSRVKSFDQCPRLFERVYILCEDKQDNAYAQWGTLMHSLLERYFRGTAEIWDLPVLYRHEYPHAVLEPFPFRRTEDSYYDRGEAYLESFTGHIGDESTILAVEDRYTEKLSGAPVTGVVDLTVRTDFGLVVCDHKSRGKWKSKVERRRYLRQLNLYAYHVHEQYGEWPDELWFNKFREGTLDREPFRLAEAEKDVDWFLRSIDAIYKAEEFPAKPDKFFCDYLCPIRSRCEHSIQFQKE